MNGIERILVGCLFGTNGNIIAFSYTSLGSYKMAWFFFSSSSRSSVAFSWWFYFHSFPFGTLNGIVIYNVTFALNAIQKYLLTRSRRPHGASSQRSHFGCLCALATVLIANQVDHILYYFIWRLRNIRDRKKWHGTVGRMYIKRQIEKVPMWAFVSSLTRKINTQLAREIFRQWMCILGVMMSLLGGRLVDIKNYRSDADGWCGSYVNEIERLNGMA